MNILHFKENVQRIRVSSQETMLRQDADDTLKVDIEKSKVFLKQTFNNVLSLLAVLWESFLWSGVVVCVFNPPGFKASLVYMVSYLLGLHSEIMSQKNK